MDERMHNAASKRAAKRVGRKASGRSSCASISHTSPSLSAKRLPSLSLPICHRRKKRKRVPKPNRWSTRPGRPWRKSHDTCSRGPRKIKKRAMSLIHVHNQLRLLLLLLLLLLPLQRRRRWLAWTKNDLARVQPFLTQPSIIIQSLSLQRRFSIRVQGVLTTLPLTVLAASQAILRRWGWFHRVPLRAKRRSDGALWVRNE